MYKYVNKNIIKHVKKINYIFEIYLMCFIFDTCKFWF